MEMMRKTLRPPLKRTVESAPERKPQGDKPKAGPNEHTNAENFYYAKQIQQKTPMVVLLKGGEEIRGRIEWYDKYAIRVAREEEPAVMVYKAGIRMMYKDEK
ncbi:MAG: RNA chaperone Hfq [Bryobacterales bacterium]|nr:RNA chaperone Hfq [Bryobacterales bacterium]